MERTTLTRNLKLVERDGLVRVCVGKDARSRVVEISTKGKKILQKAMPLWEHAQTQNIDAMGRTRWKYLGKENRTISQVAHSLI